MNIESRIRHLAIIPDGNRRWAKSRGLPAFMGHREGAKVSKSLVRHLYDRGLHTLTLWGLSTDNIEKRSKEEVGILFELITGLIGDFLKESKERKAKFIHLGRKDRLPDSLAEKIKEAEEKTKGFTDHILNLAVDYGGRNEIIRAINKAKKSNQDVTEENFADFLDTSGQVYPNPDLVVRTSGEERTSGLMPWQIALSEFYFEKVHFPELTPEILDRIIEEFESRDRRLGK